MEQVPSLAEQAYLQLQQDILTCSLSPGQVISERELGRRYEMSKTPIREALNQVCHQGLVQRLPGRGYMVAPITIKDVRDLFDMRLILEVTAAERAAHHPASAHIRTLKEMSAVSYNLDDPESHIRFLRTNREFHLSLAEAAQNRRLVAALSGLLIELDRLFHLGLRLRDSSAEMKQEHQELVACLEKGDAVRATDAIERQIMTSRDRVLEAILQGDIRPVQVTGRAGN